MQTVDPTIPEASRPATRPPLARGPSRSGSRRVFVPLVAAAGALAAFGGPALAQGAPAAPARPAVAQTAPPPAAAARPVAAEPQATTAAYGDWVLRCGRDGEAGPRLCEVAQTVLGPGGQGTLAQVAFGRTARTEPLRVTAALPPNVVFPSSVRFGLDAADPQPVELAWRRCLPGACIADAEATAAALARLRARAEPARLAFKDANGRDIVVPLSLRGLPQALDALTREGG